MSANKEIALIAGELADIELPVAPPTDWGWLISLLSWSVLWFLLAAILVWSFRNSQVFKVSVFVFWLRARWRLKSIEKAMALHNRDEVEANKATGLVLKKQAGLLYKWCQDVQKITPKIEEDYLTSLTALKAKKDITNLKSNFNDINKQIAALKEKLQFVLFDDPTASRETLVDDLQQSLQLAYKILGQLPWQQWLKMRLSSMWHLSKKYLKIIVGKLPTVSKKVNNTKLNKTTQSVNTSQTLNKDTHAS